MYSSKYISSKCQINRFGIVSAARQLGLRILYIQILLLQLIEICFINCFVYNIIKKIIVIAINLPRFFKRSLSLQKFDASLLKNIYDYFNRLVIIPIVTENNLFGYKL